MKPETIPELIVSVVLALVTVASSIALKLEAVTHTSFFAILASSTGLAGGFFAIRHYFRSQPRFHDIKTEDWQEVSTPVQSTTDVRVTIAEKTHKKGKHAKVEFLPDGLHGYSTLLYSLNAPNGDIWIYHVPNSFQYPHHVRTCRIKITA